MRKPKILFLIFACCLLIPAGTLLLAKIYFTPERVRVLAEENLGALLNDKVSIEHLDFSFSSGFEATGLSLGKGEGLLQIPRISFQYALPQLLRGNLVIEEMAVERPTCFLEQKEGHWNFEKYLVSVGSTPRKPPPTHGLALPLLPLPVHIKSLEISDLTLRLKDETHSLKWEGLDLAASAHLSDKDMRIEINLADNIKNALPSHWEAILQRNQGASGSPPLSISASPGIRFQILGDRPEEAILKGSFTLDNLLLTEGIHSIATKAGFSLDLAANPVAGEITLNHLILDFLNQNTLRLSGKISSLNSAPMIHGKLEHTTLHLPSFLPFLQPFFPNLLLEGTLDAKEIEIETLADSSGGFQTKASGVLRLDHVSLEDESKGIKLKDLNASVDMQMDGPSQGQIKIRNSIKSLFYRLPDQSEIHSSANLDLRMDLAGEKFQDIKVEGKADFPDLSVRSKDIRQTFSLSLEPRFSLNLRERKLDLEALQLHLPGNNRLTIQGTVSHNNIVNADLDINGSIDLKSLSNFASQFSDKFQMEGDMDLQRIVLSLTLNQEKNTFTAQSKGTLKMNGVKISRAEDFVKGLDGRLRWEVSDLNEEGNFSLNTLTLELGKTLMGKIQGKVKSLGEKGVEMDSHFSVDLENLGKMARITDLSPHLKGLDLDGRMESRVFVSGMLKDFTMRSHITIGGMKYPQAWPEPLSLNLETDIQCHLPEEITITQLNLSIPELGFTHVFQGELKGLEPFIKGGIEANPRNILKETHCRLKSKTSLNASRPLALFKGSKVQGGVEARFLLNLTPGKELSLEGGVNFKNLSIQQGGDLAFKNLQGAFPFQKSFSLETTKEGTRKAVLKSGGVLQNDFFSYLQGREKLTAESLTALGHELTQVHVEPSLREDSIALDRFSFQALGGYGVGHLSLSGGEKTGRISLGLEFAGIDANRLQGMGSDPRSTVNGNISLSLPLPGPAGEELELEALDVEINITKIGEGALDRLLLFIDPKESNPGIVDLRSKLKLAVPIGVWVKLKHGALSVSTQLKLLAMGGGMLDVQPLERVPVSRVSGFNKINTLLDQAKNLTRFENLLFAESLLLKEEENPKSNNEIPRGKENID